MQEPGRCSFSNDFEATESAIRITDRRIMYRRRSLLEECETVNKRLAKSIAEWEEKDTADRVVQQRVAKGLPEKKGGIIGSFLTSKHDLLTEHESKLNYIHKIILQVPNEDTKENLLAFLEDYKTQSRILGEAKHDREDLLKEVMEWLQTDCCTMQNVKGPELKVPIAIERDMRDHYQDVFFTMEKLRTIRNEMEPYKQYLQQKRQQKAKGTKQGGSTPDDSSHTCLAEGDSLTEALNQLHGQLAEAKDEFSDARSFTMKKKIEDIVNIIRATDADTKIVQGATLKTDVNMKKLKFTFESGKRDVARMQERVAELSPKAVPFVETSEKGTQTRHDIFSRQQSLVETPPSMKDSAVRKPSSFATDLATAMAEVESDQEPTEVVVAKGAPRLPSTLGQLEAGRSDEGLAGATFSRTMFGPRHLVGSAPGSVTQVSGTRSDKGLKIKPQPQFSPEEPEPQTCEEAEKKAAVKKFENRVRVVLQEHINDSIVHGKELLQEVLITRGNAAEDVKAMMQQAHKISDMEKKLRVILQKGGKGLDYMPDPDIADDCITLACRGRVGHHCPYCLCHDTSMQVHVLSTVEDAEQLSKTFQHCSQYIAAFGTMEMPFASICTQIQDIHEFLNDVKTELVWADVTPTGFKSLECEDRDLTDVVESCQEIPDNSQELVSHADFVDQTTIVLIKEIVAILNLCRNRMEKIRSQRQSLHQLEEALSRVQDKADKTALYLAEHGARGCIMDTAKIIRGSVCPYCNCYNMPLDCYANCMPQAHVMAENTKMRDVAMLRLGLQKIMETLNQQRVVEVVKECELPEMSMSLIEEALDSFSSGLGAIEKEIEEHNSGTNVHRMFVMNSDGWRKLSGAGQPEIPVTTVSVPGRGLPKLTGLKHELTDPHFYERNREDIVSTYRPQKKRLKLKRLATIEEEDERAVKTKKRVSVKSVQEPPAAQPPPQPPKEAKPVKVKAAEQPRRKSSKPSEEAIAHGRRKKSTEEGTAVERRASIPGPKRRPSEPARRSSLKEVAKTKAKPPPPPAAAQAERKVSEPKGVGGSKRQGPSVSGSAGRMPTKRQKPGEAESPLETSKKLSSSSTRESAELFSPMPSDTGLVETLVGTISDHAYVAELEDSSRWLGREEEKEAQAEEEIQERGLETVSSADVQAQEEWPKGYAPEDQEREPAERTKKVDVAQREEAEAAVKRSPLHDFQYIPDTVQEARNIRAGWEAQTATTLDRAELERLGKEKKVGIEGEGEEPTEESNEAELLRRLGSKGGEQGQGRLMRAKMSLRSEQDRPQSVAGLTDDKGGALPLGKMVSIKARKSEDEAPPSSRVGSARASKPQPKPPPPPPKWKVLLDTERTKNPLDVRSFSRLGKEIVPAAPTIDKRIRRNILRGEPVTQPQRSSSSTFHVDKPEIEPGVDVEKEDLSKVDVKISEPAGAELATRPEAKSLEHIAEEASLPEDHVPSQRPASPTSETIEVHVLPPESELSLRGMGMALPLVGVTFPGLAAPAMVEEGNLGELYFGPTEDDDAAGQLQEETEKEGRRVSVLLTEPETKGKGQSTENLARKCSVKKSLAALFVSYEPEKESELAERAQGMFSHVAKSAECLTRAPKPKKPKAETHVNLLDLVRTQIQSNRENREPADVSSRAIHGRRFTGAPETEAIVTPAPTEAPTEVPTEAPSERRPSSQPRTPAPSQPPFRALPPAHAVAKRDSCHESLQEQLMVMWKDMGMWDDGMPKLLSPREVRERRVPSKLLRLDPAEMQEAIAAEKRRAEDARRESIRLQHSLHRAITARQSRLGGDTSAASRQDPGISVTGSMLATPLPTRLPVASDLPAAAEGVMKARGRKNDTGLRDSPESAYGVGVPGLDLDEVEPFRSLAMEKQTAVAAADTSEEVRVKPKQEDEVKPLQEDEVKAKQADKVKPKQKYEVKALQEDEVTAKQADKVKPKQKYEVKALQEDEVKAKQADKVKPKQNYEVKALQEDEVKAKQADKVKPKQEDEVKPAESSHAETHRKKPQLLFTLDKDGRTACITPYGTKIAREESTPWAEWGKEKEEEARSSQYIHFPIRDRQQRISRPMQRLFGQLPRKVGPCGGKAGLASFHELLRKPLWHRAPPSTPAESRLSQLPAHHRRRRSYLPFFGPLRRSRCPYFRREPDMENPEGLALLSDLRITPSMGFIKPCPLAPYDLMRMLGQPRGFVSPRPARDRGRDEDRSEQSHFGITGVAPMQHVFLSGLKVGAKREPCSKHVKKGLFANEHFVPISDVRAPAYYLGSPYYLDRFFVGTKRSLKTLNLKAAPKEEGGQREPVPLLPRRRLMVGYARKYPIGTYPTPAEMQAYERMRQGPGGGRSAWQEVRSSPGGGGRKACVITNPETLRHVRHGQRLMEMQQQEQAMGDSDCSNLLQNILVFNVPGVHKMKNDYSGLVDTLRVPQGLDGDINPQGRAGPPLDPHQQPNLFLPTLVTGQRG